LNYVAEIEFLSELTERMKLKYSLEIISLLVINKVCSGQAVLAALCRSPVSRIVKEWHEFITKKTLLNSRKGLSGY
jgi:hypothetical protein